MNISVQRLMPQNWQEYKNLRLEGLKNEVQAFGAAYEEELSRNEESWKEWLTNGSYIFGALESDELVGCMTLFRNTSLRNSHAAHIYGAYVRKDYRGMGIGKMLLTKIIDQAYQLGIEIIYLNCTVTQKAALGLYKSLGFSSYGLLPMSIKIGDEYFDQECMYLKLKK